MSSSQLQVKYNEQLTQLLESRVLENLQKFDKGNNSAGTRARVASQELIKLLKTLRGDVLTVQKDKKALKVGGKSTTPKVEETVEPNVETVEPNVETGGAVEDTTQVVESKPEPVKKKKRVSKKST